MKQTYLFILGRQPELSLAELFGYAEWREIDLEILETTDSVAIIKGDLPEPRLLMRHLAGVVKIAEAQSPLSRPVTIDEWVERLEPILASSLTAKQSLTFGLSFYGEQKYCPSAKDQGKLALTLKRSLKTENKHLRWVSGRGQPLSSVQVVKNKLTNGEGCELVVYCSDDKVTIGKTLAVQMFEDWGERDYGRPRRNAKQGMLPPKLARMMLNMLGLPPRGTLLDPFCGSGTVLMEAALLGWPKIIGADKSASAVKDAKENIEWLYLHSNNKQELVNKKKVEIICCAIDNLSQRFPNQSIEAIVTESYLGPPLVSAASPETIANLQRELIPFYNHTLVAFEKLLKPSGRAVFILPRWIMNNNIEKSLQISELHWPSNLRRKNLLKTARASDATPLIYKRQGQFVGREIIAVEKISK